MVLPVGIYTDHPLRPFLPNLGKCGKQCGPLAAIRLVTQHFDIGTRKKRRDINIGAAVINDQHMVELFAALQRHGLNCRAVVVNGNDAPDFLPEQLVHLFAPDFIKKSYMEPL